MSVTAVPLHPTRRRTVVLLLLAVLLAVVAAAALAWAGTRDENAEFLAANGRREGVVTTASGLQYQVIERGEGPTPTDADHVFITYQGQLTDGSVFDGSEQPVDFPVQGVVPGFSEALKLMSRGARYKVWIKPELGYGEDAKTDPRTGREVIPANSILQFDIGMLGFLPEAQFRAMQMGMMPGGPGGGPPGQPGAGAPPPSQPAP